jgi:hypothetical protein
LKAIRILLDLPEQEEAATATMEKNNKAYCLQVEDTEPKETLKKQR